MRAEVAGSMAVDEEVIPPGTKVEIRNRFDASWTRGFEVVAHADDGYRVRRLSDGAELPTEFSSDEVRPERRPGNDWWWY